MEYANIGQWIGLAAVIVGLLGGALTISFRISAAQIETLKDQLRAHEAKLSEFEKKMEEQGRELDQIRAERNSLRGEVDLHRDKRIEVLEENRELRQKVASLEQRLYFYEGRKQ